MAPASILYDADCGFCRWSLAQLLRLDRRNRLRPVPLQQLEADTLLSGMSRDEQMASWHLVDDGRVYSGGAALAPLLRLLPGGRPFAAALAALPAAVGDVAYRTVAGRRSSLGRLIPAASAARARQRIEAATNRRASGQSDV